MRIAGRLRSLTIACVLAYWPVPSFGQGYPDFRAFISDDCPITSRGSAVAVESKEVSPFLSGLISAVAPSLIDSGLGLLSDAIRKASGKDSNTVTFKALGSESMHLYAMSHTAVMANPSFRCIIIAKGVFGRGSSWSPPNASRTSYFSNDVYLQDAPDFYLEAHLISSKQLAAFKLRPSYLHYKGRLNPRGKKDPRDVSVTFTFFTPEDGQDKPFGVTRLDFADLKEGESLSIDELAGRDSEWIPGRPVDSVVSETVASIKTKKTQSAALAGEIENSEKPDTKVEELRKELRWMECRNSGRKEEFCKADEELFRKRQEVARAELQEKKRELKSINQEIRAMEIAIAVNSQVNVQATLVETADINEWLASLADALEASKAKVGETLRANIIPEQRQQQEIAQQTQKIERISAYKQAVADVKIAEMKLDAERKANPQGSTSVIEAEKVLIQKRADANKAALAAGLPYPYPAL